MRRQYPPPRVSRIRSAAGIEVQGGTPVLVRDDMLFPVAGLQRHRPSARKPVQQTTAQEPFLVRRRKIVTRQLGVEVVFDSSVVVVDAYAVGDARIQALRNWEPEAHHPSVRYEAEVLARLTHVQAEYLRGLPAATRGRIYLNESGWRAHDRITPVQQWRFTIPIRCSACGGQRVAGVVTEFQKTARIMAKAIHQRDEHRGERVTIIALGPESAVKLPPQGGSGK